MEELQPQFGFGAPAHVGAAAVVAALPAGISSEHVLFDEISRSLSFPDYCGRNWDAIEECIRDLSWLSPGPVVLWHQGLPLATQVESLKIYLSILRDAMRKSLSSARPLLVYFPPESKSRIEWLLRSIDLASST